MFPLLHVAEKSCSVSVPLSLPSLVDGVAKQCGLAQVDAPPFWGCVPGESAAPGASGCDRHPPNARQDDISSTSCPASAMDSDILVL